MNKYKNIRVIENQLSDAALSTMAYICVRQLDGQDNSQNMKDEMHMFFGKMWDENQDVNSRDIIVFEESFTDNLESLNTSFVHDKRTDEQVVEYLKAYADDIQIETPVRELVITKLTRLWLTANLPSPQN